MTTHFAGQNVTANVIRAELISRSESGDKQSTELLKVLANQKFPTAGELVMHFRLMAGSTARETLLAGVGLVSFGLVFGILALTFNGFVTADVETLLVLLSAFACGQFGLIHYSKCSTVRYYAQEFQKLANILVVSSLVREQYALTTKRRKTRKAVSYAYS